jgi:hypothetical protein
MSGASLGGFYRVCVKLYSPEPEGIEGDAAAFVPVFHEWIRDRAIPDMVLIDVADYAHVPESPGIMLVAHEVSFALDRTDGRFGLLAQRRVRVDGDVAEAVAITLGHALTVASMLESDPRLAGELRFDADRPRVEANDRLRLPNTEQAAVLFETAVRDGMERVFPGRQAVVERVGNDPRDRLALQVGLQPAAQPAG